MRSSVDTAFKLVGQPIIALEVLGVLSLLYSRRTSGWVNRRRWLVLPVGYLVAFLLMWIGWGISERRASVLTAVGGITVISVGLVIIGILTLFLRDIITGLQVTPGEPASHDEREAIRVPKP